MPLFVQGSRQNLRLHARAAQRVHVRGKRSNLIVRELCPALRRHDARMLFRNRHALVDDFPDGSIASIPPQELISCEIGPKRCALAVRAMAADAGRVVVEAAPDGDLFSRNSYRRGVGGKWWKRRGRTSRILTCLRMNSLRRPGKVARVG